MNEWGFLPEADKAHGAYHHTGRCPICQVPRMAPHMDSCDYIGVWDGDTSESGWDDIDYDGEEA